MVLPRVNVCLWHWRPEKSSLSSTLSRCTDNLVQKYSIRFVKIWNLGYSINFTCWSYYHHDNDKDWMYENGINYMCSHLMKQKGILFLGSLMRVPSTISWCSKSHCHPFLLLELLHVRAICTYLYFLFSGYWRKAHSSNAIYYICAIVYRVSLSPLKNHVRTLSSHLESSWWVFHRYVE